MKKNNKVILVCSNCYSRNYSFYKNPSSFSKKIEIKKYCSTCNEHTLHKETR